MIVYQRDTGEGNELIVSVEEAIAIRELDVNLVSSSHGITLLASQTSPQKATHACLSRYFSQATVADRCHPDILSLLLKRPDIAVEGTGNDHRTPLTRATQNGCLKCMRILVDEGNANPGKPLAYAPNVEV